MKHYLYSLILVFSLALGTSASVRAEDVVVGEDSDVNATVTYITLLWENQPEVAGYNVYYGRGSGDYSRIMTVEAASATIGLRGTKTFYFAVTAFTDEGLESEFSDEVSWN